MKSPTHVPIISLNFFYPCLLFNPTSINSRLIFRDFSLLIFLFFKKSPQCPTFLVSFLVFYLTILSSLHLQTYRHVTFQIFYSPYRRIFLLYSYILSSILYYIISLLRVNKYLISFLFIKNLSIFYNLLYIRPLPIKISICIYVPLSFFCF